MLTRASAHVNVSLDAALAYARAGWRIFPCRPGEKRPATEHGVLDATDDEAIIERWWAESPSANIGLSTQGLLVVDIDDAEHNEWCAGDESRLASLSDCPRVRTPRGGSHLYFRQPAGKAWRSTASKLAPRVDTRADGGYVCVPPSSVGGQGYTWHGTTRLDAMRPEDLPEPPAWLVEELDKISSGSTAGVAATAPQEIISGQRNDALTRIAGVLRRQGLDAEEIKSALVAVNARRCSPPLDEREVERIAGSVARYEPDQVSEILTFGFGAIEETPVDQNDVPPESRLQDPGEFPLDLIEDVPGLMRDVMAWNLRSAHKPQPVLALGGALSLMSALTGRKIEDERGTRTNLYVLSMAPTGSGKERARQVNNEILSAHHVQVPNGIASASGLITQLERQPATLFQVDEFSKILRTLRDPRGGSHRFQIGEKLLTLYTTRGTFVGDVYANAEAQKIIHDPHCSVYATSTVEDMADAITRDDMHGGLLPRFLVFVAGDAPRNHEATATEPNQRILDQVGEWLEFKSTIQERDFKIKPAIVEYALDAKECLRTKVDEWDRMARGPMGELWTRAAEKTAKLALLLAASREGPAVEEIALGDVEWAASVVDWSTRKLGYIAAPQLGRNEHERDSDRLFKVIRDAGAEGIQLRRLTQTTRWCQRQRREHLLEDLATAGMIGLRIVQTKTKPINVYYATAPGGKDVIRVREPEKMYGPQGGKM